MEPRRANLGRFLEELEQAFDVLARQRGIAFRVVRGADLPAEVTWDLDRMNEVMGNLQGVTSTHIAAIRALLRPGIGHKWLQLPRGVVVERRYEVLLIHRQGLLATVDVDVPLPVPGICRIDALGVTIVSELVRHEAAVGPFPTGEVTWLDADRVGREARVRTRRPGDRLQPLGSSYSRKLKAFLIDAKVPRVVRNRLPLVVTSAGIAWVAGVRPAEWAKVVPATRLILCLQLLRHDSGVTADTALNHT